MFSQQVARRRAVSVTPNSQPINSGERGRL
jgi:hypothetical protein